ncbi:dual specificity protein kinase splB-like isoform X2 [Hermetia illucens]|nr:dual specificity protein kinase splB-like isoform X2 [Hermetia illucens]
MISPSAMAKYLQDELKASEVKHCDTCNCSPKDLTVLIDEPRTYSVGTQTLVQSESGNSLCLRCNSNLNSPSRTNSPYIMKIVKSSDSVISETKSSVSDLLDNEKLFTPAKKDDLMVNPILGHHRLCDRTVSKQQQQQICDTAKYIVETRKLENEIADLRKFNNKSPNLSLGAELCNSFSRTLQNEVEVKPLENGALLRQNGSATLLCDNSEDNDKEASNRNANLQQPVSGTCTSQKSDKSDITADKKSENKLQQETNSVHGSNDKNLDNAKNTIMGSTNSLWSKTSSSEGAKIFENFNRNLIKTIKAENPLHRGPRLCALRIQNGSNNILLDNIDSEVTPVVYTRPPRFLDEELDDTKDIITSKISMLMSKQSVNSPTTSSQINSSTGIKLSTPNANLLLLNAESGNNTTESDNHVESTIIVDLSDKNTKNINQNTDKYCDAVNGAQNADSLALNSDNPENQQSFQQEQGKQGVIQGKLLAIEGALGSVSQGVNNEVDNDRKNSVAIFDNTRNPPIHASSCLEQQQNWNRFIMDLQNNPQSKQHYDIFMLAGENSLNSSFKNTTSKSGTQSSSISSCGLDIDVQESALLRRQQLTRVAEWVQNNSQQQHRNHKVTTASQFCNSVQLLGGNHNHCSTIPQASQPRNNIKSTEKFSVSDSTNRIATNPIHMNGIQNTLNNNFYHCHSYLHQQQLQQLTSYAKDNKIPVENRHTCGDIIAQTHYFSVNQDTGLKCNNTSTPNSIDRTTLVLAKSEMPSRSNQANSHEHLSTDLAQMEYNVKQFLLKQNEWSIRNVSKSEHSTKTANTTTNSEKIASVDNSPGSCNSNSSNEQLETTKNHPLPLRTETNL